VQGAAFALLMRIMASATRSRCVTVAAIAVHAMKSVCAYERSHWCACVLRTPSSCSVWRSGRLVRKTSQRVLFFYTS
jgi:hypothetical protein